MSCLKRFTKLFFLMICLSAGLLFVLNMPVTSKQGVNYVVKTIRMPLYIKIIEFLDRDYHYKDLVQRICQGRDSDKEKVLALFEWIHQNIKTDIPQGWPVIDDHAWHVIIRGYGVRDQCSDVFTTLCNYAGADAFFSYAYTADHREKIILSFVKIKGKWSIFDPYHACYFKNKNGDIAGIEEIRSPAAWAIESLDEKPDIDYAVYFENLPSVEDVGLSRANIQSPLNRLLFAIKKITRLK